MKTWTRLQKILFWVLIVVVVAFSVVIAVLTIKTLNNINAQISSIDTQPKVVATQDPALLASLDSLATQMAKVDERISEMEVKETPIPEPEVVTPVPTEEKVAETPVITPEPTEAVTSTSETVQVKEGLFVSPVRCEESVNPESAWLVCEPGVLLDNTTAWTIPSVDAMHYLNDPEGGFSYLSMGQGNLNIDDYVIDLPYIEGHNYLVLLRGRIDDGKVDTDRNVTVEVTKFKPGHAIWSWMPKGAYVSMDWFLDQLEASTTEGYTNCGALGCSKVTVVLFDTDTKFEQRFAVKADDLLDWSPIENW